MGYKMFSDELSKIPTDKNRIVINCMNPRGYSIALRDETYRNSLMASDFLVLDGVYFAFGSLMLKGVNIKKNQGPDVFEYFINYLNTKSGRAFFLGSSVDTIKKIKIKIKKEFPNIVAEGFSPPFKNQFSEKENDEMISKINNFKPDILFVGMTAPKQEKWTFLNKNKINSKLICQIGAVFDWYSGDQKKINPLWVKFRLLWLIRTINRPEIIKRYPDTFYYFWHVILVFLRLRKIN